MQNNLRPRLSRIFYAEKTHDDPQTTTLISLKFACLTCAMVRQEGSRITNGWGKRAQSVWGVRVNLQWPSSSASPSEQCAKVNHDVRIKNRGFAEAPSDRKWYVMRATRVRVGATCKTSWTNRFNILWIVFVRDPIYVCVEWPKGVDRNLFHKWVLCIEEIIWRCWCA